MTGENKYKSAIEMRRKGQDDPDACGLEGRLYQVRDNDLEMAQFNMFWFAAWTARSAWGSKIVLVQIRHCDM